MGRKCHEDTKCLIYIRWMKNDRHTLTFCKMGIREAQKNGHKKDPNHRNVDNKTATISTTKLKY